jgi:hypothetical protein
MQAQSSADPSSGIRPSSKRGKDRRPRLGGHTSRARPRRNGLTQTKQDWTLHLTTPPLDGEPFGREIESGWEPVEDLPVDYK